jgi:hypothetical protein
MTVSINYLRTIVKNCNSTINQSNDLATIQRATLQRERTFQAIKTMQAIRKSGSESLKLQLVAMLPSLGIQTTRDSGKDSSTWKPDDFGMHLKGRFGINTLNRIADKQENGIEHGDIGVVRNLGNQYGRLSNPPKDKVKHVAGNPQAKYKDIGTVQNVTKPSGELLIQRRTVIGHTMPRVTPENSFSPEKLLAESEILLRAGKRLERAKRLRRLAKTAYASQSVVRAERQAIRDTKGIYGKRAVV